MTTVRKVGVAAILFLAALEPLEAADYSILGQRMLVRAVTPQADRSKRIAITGRERPTDLPALSDPRVSGATLHVITRSTGEAGAVQSFALDAAGWSASGSTGYRYRGPTGLDQDPVRRVVIRVKPGRSAMLSANLSHRVSDQSLDIVPPDPGTSGGLILEVAGGDRYCVQLGGAAGGTVRSDTPFVWQLVGATAEAGCPALPACGDGIVDVAETCDGAASPACDNPFGSDAVCGEADDPNFACDCCFPEGTTYSVEEFGPRCCDGLPSWGIFFGHGQAYCAVCLPDGFDCSNGPESCCSGTCFGEGVPDVEVPFCGDCREPGESCLSDGYCCEGVCNGGICE